MIGKSYDGTLANGAASTGVEGLSTIVPISAISSWYDYTRSNGVVTRGNSYPSSLSNTVTDPDRRAYCAAVRATMALTDGDETGDYTPFWLERDYNARRRERAGERLRRARPAGRQRDARPLLEVVGRAPGERGQEALADPHGPHRPVRLPPRGVGRDAAPVVRPRAPGRAQRRAHRAPGRHRVRGRRVANVQALADRRPRGGLAEAPRRHADDGRGSRARAAADAEPAPRPPDDHGHAVPEREQCDLEPDDGDREPAHLPLDAARGSRPHLRHAGGADPGVRERDRHELRRDPRRLRAGHPGLASGRRRADARRRRTAGAR